MQRELNGKPVAAKIEAEVKSRAESFYRKMGRKPSLRIVLVGNNPASEVYVRNKCRACERVGIQAEIVRPEGEAELRRVLTMTAVYEQAHGLLLQLPLPADLRPKTRDFFKLISPLRDVDCLNPENVGLLVQEQHRFFAATPHAVAAILQHYDIPIAGQHVVVISRSDVVGKPLSAMLIHDDDEYANATVTVCHIRTPDWQLRRIASTADILVTAVGIPGFVTADMVNSRTVLVDVAINRLEDGRIVGDASDEALGVVRAYTPVPGGVGPVTVATVLLNTITAAESLESVS